jgi:hypothetical protein
VSTAIVSDLHLANRPGTDLLSRPEIRGRLIEAIEGVDRVVLLGDLVELREAPVADAVEAARPLFRELGEAVGDGHIVVVPGNHDYQLAADLLEPRRLEPDPAPLEAEQQVEPASHSPLGRLAASAGRAKVTLAYPGVWLRPDVYATHGHYMDYHNTVPTFERLAAGISRRIVGPPPDGRMTPDDYEAALSPIYSLAYQLAQASPAARRVTGGGTSVRIWQALSGNHRAGVQAKVAGALVGGVLWPGAVAALNALRLGPLNPDLSGRELRRAGLRGMAEVVVRLGVDAEHVIFGHTHRAGPFPGDDEDWDLPGGGRLTNSGSWLYDWAFIGRSGSESPYWPGVVIFVEDEGPPELRRLLDDLTPEELLPERARAQS